MRALARRLPSADPATVAPTLAASVFERIGHNLPRRIRAGDDALAGKRALFAVGGALAGVTAGGAKAVVAPVLLGGAGWYAAGFVDARRARERATSIEEALPDAIDLLTLCVLGGMGIDPALRTVGASARGPLAEAMAAMIHSLDVGLPRNDAYAAFERAAHAPAATALVTTLRRAERYGVPLADVLAAQAAEARDQRRTRMRERAMGAPVRMLFPLTLCFLPAFVLLAIAPSLLVAFQSFKKW